MDYTQYKKFERHLECDYPETYDADGYIIEIPKTTNGETWWAKIIEAIHNAGKECCLLTDYGMTDAILELGINSSEWKTSQIPKIVELVEKYLANKDVDEIIFDVLKIKKDSGKYYTPIWIQTYTDYLLNAIKTAYPAKKVSLLIRQSIYDEIDGQGGRENLLALMNKWGVSIVYGCDLDEDSYPASDEVITAPYYGSDLSKVAFVFYDFSDPWLALKMETKETEETESGETEETETEDTGETGTGTEATDTTTSTKLDAILAHLKKLAWLEK